MTTETEPHNSPASSTPEPPNASASSEPTAGPAAFTAPREPIDTTKPIHSLIVDTGPLIKNDPPVSTLLARAHELYTTPDVVGTEIRDAATRARVETTLLPFLKVREPRPASVRVVREFARRTGDLGVLSRPDIALLALAYELECERNGGDWRLRSTPGQQGLNGKPPGKEEKKTSPEESQAETTPAEPQDEVSEQLDSLKLEEQHSSTLDTTEVEQTNETYNVEEAEESSKPEDDSQVEVGAEPQVQEEDDDDEGWITPSNLKKHQEKDGFASSSPNQQPAQRFLQVALLTSDFAMQNVLLRMNLNLVSPTLARITRVKTWALRCHGCFLVTRRDADAGRQFCPRCGQPTLTRVSVSADQATGAFTVHLKKNFQWNNRGNVYSVPKPVHGSASGKNQAGGGGKNGWGRDLMLTEDQKEYVRKKDEQRKLDKAGRDLMDEDYLPSILSGDRKSGGPGRIKVGAGRNVNSRKRR